MGIDSMKGIDNLSSRPTGVTRQVDSVSKNIQKEISETQRQRQELSSKEDMPVAEKVKKRQELQQKISSLNRELRQRQAETRKEQQKETLINESRTGMSDAKSADEKDKKTNKSTTKDIAEDSIKASDAKPKDAGRTDSRNDNLRGADSSVKKADDKASQNKDSQDKDSRLQTLQNIEIPQKDWKAVVESDSSKEQIRKQETVIARIEGGIAILKSEIKLDEARGADVSKKQAELKKQEEKLQKASASQYASPDRFNQAGEKTAPAKIGEKTNFSKEKETAEQQPLFQDITVSLMS